MVHGIPAHRPGRTLVRVAVAALVATLAFGLWSWGTAQHALAQDGNGITNPTMGAPVRGVVAVEGIAVHPDFRKWQLDLLLGGNAESASFLAVSEAAAPTPTILAGWDTTRYPDGYHMLRLRVVHSSLNYDEYLTPVRIRNSGAAAVSLVPVQSLLPSAPVTETAALTSTLGLTVVPESAADTAAEIAIRSVITSAITGTVVSTATTALASAAAITRAELITALITAPTPITDAVAITAEAPITEPAYFALFDTSAPAGGRKLIEIDLSDQTLTAWQGDVMVFQTSVSTGKPEWWTLPGTFKTYLKYEKTRMKGGRDGDVYDTPDVPWTMYYDGDFAIHGAYWHNNFGTPVSHGCVNLRVEEAKALYAWAPLGTTVTVHQ